MGAENRKNPKQSQKIKTFKKKQTTTKHIYIVPDKNKLSLYINSQ